MKTTTKQSSAHLRVIARLVLILGVIIGIYLGIIGIMTIASDSSRSSLLGLGGYSLIIIGLLIMFWHYVSYVMISAYATIVENSDKTEVVRAVLHVATKYNVPSYDHDDSFLDLLDSIEAYTSKLDKEYSHRNDDV